MNYIVKIIYKVFLIFFTLGFCFSCEKGPGDKQSEYFVKFYGTYFNNIPADIIPGFGGGYVITGESETELNGNDIFFIQTDKYGRQIGDIKYYGSADSDEKALCIEKLDDGYLIGGSVMYSNGTKDAILLELDREGNQVGDIVLYGEGNSQNEEFSSIKKLNDGTYMAVGFSNSKFLVIKFDPVNKSFRESLADLTTTKLNKLTVSSEGRLISAGTENNILNLVHIDQNGNYFAQDKIGDIGLSYNFGDFIQKEDGNYILLSNIIAGSNSIVNLREIEFSYAGSSDNPSMEEISSKDSYGDIGSNTGNSIIQLSNGNLAMLVTRTFKADKNILLYILDEGGNMLMDPKEMGGIELDQEGIKIIADNESILILGINALENNSMITLIKADNKGNIWEQNY